jgi:hypothetical protein
MILEGSIVELLKVFVFFVHFLGRKLVNIKDTIAEQSSQLVGSWRAGAPLRLGFGFRGHRVIGIGLINGFSFCEVLFVR